jgi:hypothetical protein
MALFGKYREQGLNRKSILQKSIALFRIVLIIIKIIPCDVSSKSLFIGIF